MRASRILPRNHVIPQRDPNRFFREQNESALRTSGDRYEAGESDNGDSDGYQINAETSATHNWDAKLPYCTTRGIRERALESGR